MTLQFVVYITQVVKLSCCLCFFVGITRQEKPAMVAEWLERQLVNLQRQPSCFDPGLNPALGIYTDEFLIGHYHTSSQFTTGSKLIEQQSILLPFIKYLLKNMFSENITLQPFAMALIAYLSVSSILSEFKKSPNYFAHLLPVLLVAILLLVFPN